MSYPNRELSQFASFLRINDSNRKIAITTETTPFVGIGSTVPTEKLDVLGNIKSSGIVSAIAFYGDGSNLDNVTAIVDGYFLNTVSGIWTGKSVGIGVSTFNQKLNVDGAVLASRFISNVPSGTAPFQVASNTLVSNLNASFLNGRTAPTGNIVGTGDTQTLTNKTLTSPFISIICNGNATLNIPTTSGTLLHSGAVGIITSSLYGNGSINNVHVSAGAAVSYSKLNLNNSIVNADVKVGAGISYSKLNLTNSIKSSDIDPNNKIQNNNLLNKTISNIELGQDLKNLIAGNYLKGESYNGSSEITIDVDATSENVAGTVVVRDEEGSIKAKEFIGGGSIPIMGIIMWGGSQATAIALEPQWALCDGRTVNGITTPNLRDRFIVAATGPNGYQPGDTGGLNYVKLSVNEIPSHSHPSRSGTATNNINGGPFVMQFNYLDPTDTNASFYDTGFTGGNASHENRPPYYALAFIMRTK